MTRKMTVLRTLLVLLSLLLTTSLAPQVRAQGGGGIQDEFIVEIPHSPVDVTAGNPDPEGYAHFLGEDIQYLSLSGEPAVPYQVIKVLLPPDADLATVSVSVEQENVEEVSGEWEVEPIPPMATWDGEQVLIEWPEDKTIVDGRDVGIYETDAPFPSTLLGNISSGRMRKWVLVEVPIVPYQYNPVTKTLYRLTEANLVVRFTRDPSILSAPGADALFADRISEDIVERLTVNFPEMVPEYAALLPTARSGEQGSRYVIITTNEIRLGSSQLDNFISSKEQRGFTVQVVTEETWGGGTGDTAAENIRNWLAANYAGLSIEYVLLIGNPHPTSGNVPMKMLWPRYNYPSYREAPSDYYYADLTGNWDWNGDGIYGEWYADFDTGGVDRNWEVLVGRIPYYGSMADLDHILAKIIAYENTSQSEAAWRRNVLLPMMRSDSVTPGYHLGEQIKDAVIEPKGGWNYHRAYEQGFGLIPPPETVCATTPYLCYNNVARVTNAWNSSPFGAIFWWTHGSSRSASYVMNVPHAATLNDNYSGFTFQASCNNSWPEDTSNLSYALLKNGAISTVGATRVSWYYVGQSFFAGSSSNSGMTYEYAKRLITDEMDSGHALYDLKQVLHPGLWMNWTVFNLYGDPATGLFTYTSLPNLWAVEYRWGDPPPGYSFADWPIFEGWMNVRIHNRSNFAAFNVTATVTDWPANTTVPDPDVTVGDIPAWSSAWSVDTFTTRVDMTIPGVDPCEGVFWRIEYDDAYGYHHIIENVPQFPPGEGPCD